MIKEIAFTCYAVTDIKRARAFYEGVLGLVTNGEFPGSENWIEYAVGSGTLAIGSSSDWKPSVDGASIALEVEDFPATLEKLKKAGIPFKMDPYDGPTCSMVVIQDPDKNKVVLHKRKNK